MGELYDLVTLELIANLQAFGSEPAREEFQQEALYLEDRLAEKIEEEA